MAAVNAKIDWVKMTNPFGAPPEKEKPPDKQKLAKSLLMNLRAAGARKAKG
jgi:hypothetical protein